MFRLIGAVILSAAVAIPAFAFTKTEREGAYAAAGLKKRDGGKYVDGCDREVTPDLHPVKLDAHGGEAAMLKIDDGVCYGNTGSQIMLFRKEGNRFHTIFDNIAGGVTILRSSHMGMFDIELGVPGMDIPIWKWNGQNYEFWKSIDSR